MNRRDFLKRLAQGGAATGAVAVAAVAPQLAEKAVATEQPVNIIALDDNAPDQVTAGEYAAALRALAAKRISRTKFDEIHERFFRRVYLRQVAQLSDEELDGIDRQGFTNTGTRADIRALENMRKELND